MKSLPLATPFRLLLLCCVVLQAQPNGKQQQKADHLKVRQGPYAPAATNSAAASMAAPQQIKLTVPAGTPIRIAISKRVRIAHAGAPVMGE